MNGVRFFTKTPTHLISGIIISFLFFLHAAAQSEPPAASETLRKCLEIPVSTLVGPVAAHGNAIYAGVGGGGISAFSRNGGNILWSAELGGEIVSNILASSEHVVIVTSTTGHSENKQISTLRSVSPQTGITKWATQLQPTDRAVLFDSGSGKLLVLNMGGSIYEVSLSSGTIDKTLTVGSSISVSAFDSRENLALGTGEKQLIVSSIGNGQVLLRKAITQMPTSLRFLDSGSIAVGDDRGNVTIYDKDGKEEWAFRNGATISFLETVEDELLAASHDNFLYLLNVSNGGVIWKRRLSGRIAHAPIVVADSIFVVAYGDHFAYEIDRKSGKIINKFRISAEDLPITGPVKLDSRTFALPANKAIAIYSAGICKQK